MYILVPGSLHNNSGNIQIEILAGLTSAKDFPSQDVQYINGITSSDYEGSATNDQVILTTWDSDADLPTVNNGDEASP